MHTALQKTQVQFLALYLVGSSQRPAAPAPGDTLYDVQVQLHACVNIPAHGYAYIAIIYNKEKSMENKNEPEII